MSGAHITLRDTAYSRTFRRGRTSKRALLNYEIWVSNSHKCENYE